MQKRPIILRSLLIEATPYPNMKKCVKMKNMSKCACIRLVQKKNHPNMFQNCCFKIVAVIFVNIVSIQMRVQIVPIQIHVKFLYLSCVSMLYLCKYVSKYVFIQICVQIVRIHTCVKLYVSQYLSNICVSYLSKENYRNMCHTCAYHIFFIFQYCIYPDIF